MAFGLKKFFPQITKTVSVGPKKVVGIDFGASSIKVVELEKRDEVVVLSSYGELQLGPYGESDMGKPTALEQPKKVEALVDIMREANIQAKNGVLALPLSSSFVTVMDLTAEPEEDISSRVRVEARKYIPVPISDVTLDWSELTNIEAEAGISNITVQREILVAAIQNESLAQMNELMQSISMVSQPSEIELFSTIRAINKETDETVAIIDLGARTSKMYIADKGLLKHIHRAHAGGTHATEKIAKTLNVPFTEAENIKRNYREGEEGSKEIKKVFVSNFERPMQEFRRVLEQYEKNHSKKVTRVVLSGGSAAFPAMPNFASYMFDRDVSRANPFNKVAYPAFMEDVLTEIAPTFTVALGSAMRPFEVTE